jgi:hypothetical protein
MIKLLNGEQWDEQELLVRMLQDDFYYGYLGQHALSSSSAKKLLESPKAYHRSLTQSMDSQALRDGRLIHLSLLEPEKVENLHIIKGTKASKLYKGAAQEFGSANVYTESEHRNAKYITDELNNCSAVRDLLDGAMFEVPAIGNVYDLPFRAKADILKPNVVIDLKTTSDINAFRYSAKKFSYDLQAALYMELFGVDEFVFLVIDKKTKEIAIYNTTGDFAASGWNKLEDAVESYKKYLDPKFKPQNYVRYGTL